MEAKTHIIGGVAAGLFVAGAWELEPIMTVAAAAAGGLLPDIDHARSRITNANPLFRLISAAVNVLFTHRTFTHSLLFVLLMMAWMNAVNTPDSLMARFGIGLISHIFLDMCTKQGVALFFPLQRKVGFPFGIRTGGALEKIFMAGLIVLCIGLGIKLF